MQPIQRRRQFIKSIEAKSLATRPALTHLADELTSLCGSPVFLLLNFILFAGWVAVNMGILPIVEPFDPFPFGLLTMIVSLEAIMLAIFVLISQNRSAYINTIRDEVHLQVNLKAEEEITKILEVLKELREKQGITTPDPELDQMIKRTDSGYIEQAVIKELVAANGPILQQLVKEFPDIISKFDPLKLADLLKSPKEGK